MHSHILCDVNSGKNKYVLILVLMEDALALYIKMNSLRISKRVLILVLMEDALARYHASKGSFWLCKCLNPCFNG